LFVLGYATEDAVIARILQEVIGVTYCNVISNREDTVDSEGRPGHCGETIVIGGEDTAIAKKLWEVWPAGIEFYGNTSIEITDSTNNKQLIKFSRPVIVYIWAKIIITKSSEESFEASLDDIQNNIAKSENSVLEVGSDVPWQRIYKYIYGVKGVISATIVLGSSASPEVEATNYATANISIGSVQLAQFDAARIEVTAI
jgi:uncharacterized phage protein gp47/JayE